LATKYRQNSNTSDAAETADVTTIAAAITLVVHAYAIGLRGVFNDVHRYLANLLRRRPSNCLMTTGAPIEAGASQ
jgi:hypothetical protein